MAYRPHLGAPPAAGKIQKAAFAAIVFSHAVNDMSSAFFAPLAPLIAKDLGLSLTAIGLLMSIRSISGSLPQPLFGWLSDRYPSRWWLIPTPIVVGFSRTAIGFASGFWSLAAILSLGSLGGACYHPSAAAAARSVSAGRRGLVMSTYVAAGRLGNSAGPIVALGLVSVLGLKGLMAAAGFYVVSMMILARYAPAVPAVPAASAAPGKAPPSRQERVREAPDRWRPVALLYLINIFRNMVMINLYGFLPLFFAGRGGTLWEGGGALSLLLVAGGIGGMAGGWLSDRIGRRNVIFFSALAMFPSLLIFLRAEGLAQFALIVPLGLFLHASMGVSVAYAQELLPNRPALAASLVQGGNWFISGLTLAGMGALGDRLGLDVALQLLAVLVLAEIAASLALPKEEG